MARSSSKVRIEFVLFQSAKFRVPGSSEFSVRGGGSGRVGIGGLFNTFGGLNFQKK